MTSTAPISAPRAVDFRLRFRFRGAAPALAVLCLLASAAGARAADKATEKIVGTWRGTSICVDHQAAPACNDETVVYDIVAVAGSSSKVTVKADKIVNGERLPMGDLDFTAQADGAWIAEIETPRVHGTWKLVVDGKAMTGSMWLLPSKAVVRRMELTRVE